MSGVRALALSAAALCVLAAPRAAARAEALPLAALDGLEGLLPDSLLGNAEELLRTAAAACELLPLELISRALGPAPPLAVVEVSRGARRRLPAARAPLALHRWRARTSSLTLYIPGWWNTPDDEAAQALASALLKEHPVVLILDTRSSFCRGYLSAASRVNSVSHLLYYFIKNLNKYGFRPSDIHLIGFSLGAHVAGMTGKLVQKGLKTKIGRITALDPAKPCFGRSEDRLRRGDAAFVQVVHSSAGILGVEEPAGHADVYVNGVAVRQPECRHRPVSFECDHNRAWRLFAASVRDPRAMTGRRCRSWAELAAAHCSGPSAVLGYSTSNHSAGMYLYKSTDST